MAAGNRPAAAAAVINIAPDDESEEVDSPRSPGRHQSDRDDHDDAIDIKPPQATAEKKEKHKRKHKEDRRRERERDRGEKHREREKIREGQTRIKERPVEVGRERGKVKEVEARRREKSIKERERLERLERERFRLERERMRREEEHREMLMRAERDKDRERKREESRRRKEQRRRQEGSSKHENRPKEKRGGEFGREKSGRGRSRSPVVTRGGRDIQQDGSKRERVSKDPPEERGARERMSRSPELYRPEPSRKERPAVVTMEVGGERDMEIDDVLEEHRIPEGPAEPDEMPASGSEEDSGSESDSGDSDSDSDSESADSEAGSGKDPGKMKSKFDSGAESEPESLLLERSDHDDHDYLDDTPPQSPIELLPDLPPYLPALQGCRSVEEFSCLNRIEEGTYGVVFRALDKKTDKIVALKKLKMEKEKEGFPITSLREINTLLKAQHPNIVTVREIVVGSNMDKIYIVMEYVEHDLKSLMEVMKAPFITGEVKTLMRQLLRGITHLHDNWIIHRDLKTSNLLLSHKGILKIGDFGLAREYGSPLKQYTPIVVTLWYRAPELLLGTKLYTTAIDLWSIGCIFAEFLTRNALFPGKSEIDQLNRIFKELGTPNDKIWPGVGELPYMKKCTFAEYPYNQLRNRFGSLLSDKGFDLMNRFLTYNPTRRITPEEALRHEYFKEMPLPVEPSLFPTWPAKSEQPRRTAASPKPPSGGKAFSKFLNDDDDIGGFHLGTATKGASAVGMGFALKF